MAVVLCIIFMSVEVVGGIKANSLAILTDAAHLLSDVAAFAISLFSLWASGWETTPRQSYGFFRIEILGALVSIQMIWLLAGILVYEAIVRLIHDTVTARHLSEVKDENLQKHEARKQSRKKSNLTQKEGNWLWSVDAEPSTEVDSVALIPIDLAGYATHHHHHHEGHSKYEDGHHHTHEANHTEPLISHSGDANKSKSGSQPKKQRNINVQGAYLHIVGDSIQSVGVMIGGAIIWYKPEWKINDLICTLVFSVIVLGTTIRMLRNILEVLMESTSREIDATRLEKGLCEMDEVLAIHELHIWAITQKH
ncbi:hypothetical protein Ddye_003015 [Dipteronia dyeriana]|uniref:Cation efflux protein transmembrane domain-containing protein n=1 Tax=Dipteronia dyeriana TaxID=168575 RepID=A0AAD9XRD5_9ROSI|nr:hypothetical protein Ddye_003015 [Dipteronia dyeriana]